MASSILLSHPLPSQLHLRKPKFVLPYSSKFSCFYPKSRTPFEAHFINGPQKLKKLVVTRVLKTEAEENEVSQLVGEDSAEFELSKQKISSWVYFSLILGVVLYILDVAWIDNSTGFGKDFIGAVSSVSESPEV